MLIGAIVGAAVGGGLNLTSSLLSMKSQKDALRKQKRQLESLRDTYLNNLDQQFRIETAEANNKAAEQDKTTDVQESAVGESFNDTLDNVRQQQENDALSFNNAAIQAGQSTGNELASMAASGTRSSSMADAVDQEAAMNSQQLQAQEDTQRTSQKSAINQAILQLATSQNALQQQRTSADALRNSYANGGNQYINYKQTRDYNEQQYNNSIDQINDQMEDLSFNWNTVLKVGASVFTGASSGASLGYSMGNLAKYAATPSTAADGTSTTAWQRIGQWFSKKWGASA